VRGSLFNWEPGWSGTTEDEKKNEGENKDGKTKRHPFRSIFPFKYIKNNTIKMAKNQL
jgi:hypothetical protein